MKAPPRGDMSCCIQETRIVNSLTPRFEREVGGTPWKPGTLLLEREAEA